MQEAIDPSLNMKPDESFEDVNPQNQNNNDVLTMKPSHQEEDIDVTTTQAKLKSTSRQIVPSTWGEALHHFFLKEVGPFLVLLTISRFIYARFQLSSTTPLSITELSVFISSILLWSVQEYFIHRVLLHSPIDGLASRFTQSIMTDIIFMYQLIHLHCC